MYRKQATMQSTCNFQIGCRIFNLKCCFLWVKISKILFNHNSLLRLKIIRFLLQQVKYFPKLWYISWKGHTFFIIKFFFSATLIPEPSKLQIWQPLGREYQTNEKPLLGEALPISLWNQRWGPFYLWEPLVYTKHVVKKSSLQLLEYRTLEKGNSAYQEGGHHQWIVTTYLYLINQVPEKNVVFNSWMVDLVFERQKRHYKETSVKF